MARIYATPADLAEWSGKDAPENAAGLLRYASHLVEQATFTAFYQVKPDGTPWYGPVADAFRDATTAQAAYWAANGLDPAAGALGEQSARVATSKTIKGASLGYDAADAAKTKEARVQALESLCWESGVILQNAGLLRTAIQ